MNETVEKIMSPESAFMQSNNPDGAMGEGEPTPVELDRFSKICLSRIRFQPKIFPIWALLSLFVMAFVICLSYWGISSSGSSSLGVMIPQAISLGLVPSVFFVVKAISSWKHSRYFSTERHFFSKAMPEEANSAVKEFYFLQHWRACSVYWSTVFMALFCFLNILYGLIACGIHYAVKTELPKIFQASSWTDYPLCVYKSISQRQVFIPITLLLVIFPCYFISIANKRKTIQAIEKIYGMENLMDDVVLFHRLENINKKYKTQVFVTFCIVGCVPYLFFKRTICAAFDKSFRI